MKDLVSARWPKRNKLNTISEYRKGLDSEWDYAVEQALVTDSVQLTNEEFASFTENLLTDRDFLAGKGGTETTAQAGPWDDDVPFHKWSPEDMTRFREGSYRLVVEVISEDGRFLYIDPQGYDYARYVGFPLEGEATGALPIKSSPPAKVVAASAPENGGSRIGHLMDMLDDQSSMEDW